MKIRTYHFLIILIFIGCSRKEKDISDYDELFYEGMIQYKDHNYQNALSKFEKAIRILPNDANSIYLYAAASAFHLEKNEKAKNLIIESIHQTNTNQAYLNSFVEFQNFKDNKIFESINSNYEKHIETFEKNVNHPEIYAQLDSLIAVDQKVRTDGTPFNEIAKVDSSNVQKLIEITERYGWKDKGWLILWHQRMKYDQDNWVWNYFRPIINEEIKKGNVRKSFWAQFEEFKNIAENKYQEYGLYPHNFDTYPLKDPKKVDLKRDSVNLPPLWIMNKVHGWPLPNNYKKNYSL